MNQLICLVCGETTGCLYFGAISCRACAAFFRRKVIECRKIPRRCDGKCKITARRRNSCVHCRFEKCLNVGMKMTAVKARLEQNGSHELVDNIFLSDPLSLLERIQEAYQKLEQTRKATFELKDNYEPQLVNYKQMNSVVTTDFKVISRTTAAFFESITDVCSDQKKHLFRNFLLKFFMLEGGFKAKDSVFTVNLANGDFMNFDNRHHFYTDPESMSPERKEKALRLMEPYWLKMGNSVVADFSRAHIDLQEFLFLTALLYWDFGIQNQSAESIDVCIKMRKKVVKELTEYEKTIRINEDSYLRVGEIMFLLQTLQKGVDLIDESRQLLMICDLCDLHCGMLGAFDI